MTRIINNLLIISQENPQQCDFCGEVAELRPYGAKNEVICFDCAMKDPERTKKKFKNYFL